MSVADYSKASSEERQQVIDILQRNLQHLLKAPGVKDRNRLQHKCERFVEQIRAGETIRGKEYETLVSILRRRIPPGM
jgi:hypothetical protein